jgi:filamentous hemagglutinin family protein
LRAGDIPFDGRAVRAHVLGTAALIAIFLAGIATGQAQPVGASVVAGQAQVSTAGDTTLINQASSKAIINWRDFSVPAGTAVQFNQPNSASITLNRITGSAASAINGTVNANGQVWLLNPNGVLFGQGANINIGGLLATTSDVANSDFLNGRYNFSRGGGSVVNSGTIHAASGGSVVLSAPNVLNTGLIEANAGHVVLGGADAFTVDFTGDRLLSYQVGPASSGRAANAGTIRAQGGKVLLTARAAADIADNVVNNTGMIEATSARVENGEIILEADGGAVVNSGTLDASGKGAGETGGSVQVLGQMVAVADGARIDVSGDAGGGNVLIGGNFHGAGPQPNADNTTVGKAVITADAIHSGSGGKVAIWSNGTTRVAAAISAKGGPRTGNGGQVETSGHQLHVGDATHVDTSAPAGAAGNWLLDPQNITIADTGVAGTGGQTFATTGDVTISPGSISLALMSGNVQLQANDDITLVNGPIGYASGTATLELDAGRSILFQGGSIDNGGRVILSANDSNAVSRTAGAAGSITGGSVNGSQIDFILGTAGLAGTIGTAGSPVLINGAGGVYIGSAGADAFLSTNANASLALGNASHGLAADLGAGNLNIIADGVTQTAPLSVTNLTIQLPSGAGTETPVTLTDVGNAISGTINVEALGGAQGQGSQITITNSQAMTMGALTVQPGVNSDRGDLLLTTGNGGITLTGAIQGGQLSLNAEADITESSSGSIHSYANGSQGASGGLAVNSSDGLVSLTGTNLFDLTTGTTGNGQETQVTHIPQIALGSSGSFTLNTASSVALYAGNFGGNFTLNATGNITLSDAGGNAVKRYNTIDLYNPVTSGGFVTLHATGDITQQIDGMRSVYIQAATGLSVTSDNGNIVLNDGGHASGGNFGADPGNQIGGDINAYTVLNSPVGDASFTSTKDTIFGGPAYYPNGATPSFPFTGTPSAPPANYTSPDSYIGGNLTLTVTDANAAGPQPAVLVVAGRIHMQNRNGGYSTVHASGDLDNNNGDGTLIAGLAGANSNLSLISDNRTIGSNDGTSWSFGDGADSGTLNLQALAPNGAIVINPGDLNIGIVGLGNGGLNAQSVLIFGNGIVSQNNDASGTITTVTSLDIHALNDVILNNTANAVTTWTGFITPGNISYTNSLAATVIRAGNGIDGTTGALNKAGDISITAPAITLGNSSFTYQPVVNGPVLNALTSLVSSGTVTLAATAGDVSDGYSTVPSTAGFVSAPTLLNVSATGGAISLTNPANIMAALIAATSNRAIAITTGGFNSAVAIGANGVNAGTGDVTLIATGAQLDGTNGAINGGNVFVAGKGLYLPDITASNLSAQSTGGAIELDTAGFLQITNLRGGAGIDAAGGSVTLSGNGISQANGAAGAILAGSLSANAGAGNLALASTINAVTGAVSLLAIGGDADFTNAVSTHLATASVRNQLLVQSSSDLEILSGATLSSAGGNTDSVVLTAAGHFLNSAGSNAMAANNARWLIYSHDPAGDSFNGLNSANTAIWNTSYPTTVSASGNRYVFTQQPIIAVTAGDLSKVYGTNLSSLVAGDYTISGLQPGVANAFVGDTAASVYAGTPSLNSAGAAANANVAGSPYTIAVASGSFTVTDGYGLSLQSARLTITPALLTYVANAASRSYGAVDPSYNGSVTGFVNGETIASATTGTLTFAAAATTSSNVGTYAINGKGLSAGNYLFTQAGGNATALAITRATLTYVATAASRSYGDADPSYNGSVTGFVNGETIASATTGALTFATTATASSSVGAYAIDGKGLSAGNYLFTQAGGNATALTITPAILTEILTGTVSKTFDGTTTALLAPGNYAGLLGVLGNDDVQLAAFPANGLYDSAAIGLGKTVTVSGLSLVGGKAGNYVIAGNVSGAIGVITAPASTGTGTGLNTGTNTAPIGATLVSVTNANQNSLSGSSRPGTLYLETGTGPAAQAPDIQLASHPIALLTPTTINPIADLVAASTAGEAADPPTFFDQATDYVVASLDGVPATDQSSGPAMIIPGLLHAAPTTPQAGLNSSDLSGWGNAALWQ